MIAVYLDCVSITDIAQPMIEAKLAAVEAQLADLAVYGDEGGVDLSKRKLKKWDGESYLE